MRSVLALIRVSWLSFSSYRLNVVFSIGGLVALFIPVYLIARSLQPIVADSIADEGGVYFGFIIAGLAVMQLVGASVRGLPDAVSGGISSGTLEALLATPTPIRHILAGMVGYGLLWSTFRAILLLGGIALVGGTLAVGGLALAALILLIVVLAHLPFGILLASGILVFRTTGPLESLLLGGFSLLGGVYYSTTVIPEVVRPLASIVPLTYGLRAFRQALLSGEPLSAVLADVAILVGFAVVMLAVSLAVFRSSLRYARRMGTLAQY